MSKRFVGRSGGVDVALLGVAAAWGSSYLAAKEVATPATVFSFLVLRFAVAVGGFALMLAPRLRHLTRIELGLGALFGAVLAAIFTLETFGVVKTSASNAGLIISLTIVLTPMLEQRVTGRRLPSAFYAAAGLAVLGVAALSQSGGFSAPGLGDVLMLAAAAVRAVHVVLISRLSAGRTVDSGRLTLVQLVTALLIFAVVSLLTGQSVAGTAAAFSARSWWLVGYLAVVCTVFAFAIQTWVVRRTSPARVSLLLGTEPLWAVVVGVGIAGDPITGVGVVGAVLIVLGTNWGRIVEGRPPRTVWTPSSRTTTARSPGRPADLPWTASDVET